MENKTLEMVVFELNEGVTEEEFMATVPAVSKWASRQPGFISRELVHSAESGKYVEIVWWQTRADADAAAAAAMSSTSCSPMFAKIAMDSMLMLHGDLAEQLAVV